MSSDMRGSRWRGLVGLGLCAVLVLAAGCSGGKLAQQKQQNSGGGGGHKYTFALISHGSPGDSFWATVDNGAKAAAKQYGVTVNYQASGGDPNKQAQLVNNAVAKHVDGLIVSLANPGALKGPLQQAENKGIPVTTINSGSDVYQSVGALTHVGQDETKAGEAAGRQLSSMGLKKVVCVIHEQNNVGLQDRCNGTKKTFSGQLVDMQVTGTSDVNSTVSQLKSKLSADSSIDGVLTLNPDIAQAAEQSIAGSNSKAKLATFDLSTDVLKGVDDGKVAFAISQQPYLQGYLPVVSLYLYKTTQNIPGGGAPVYSGPTVVTKANAKAVLQSVQNGTYG
ncbi:MAG: sugar ABC transporter substrate-binding protein [Streptosporangiales bacterium]|nr:sugar ABC transporter substrate-binding protein [Streptosporangiales bacterium]MBO0889921.1 sugar ABC transporter substrate-binding protein [Acidothermales bacterium]